MAFDITFYHFSKRENSTARPSGGTSYNCVLKTASGILNPSITLNLGLIENPYQYNYAYIPSFDRYYFVREWVFEHALWTALLSVDALASWKASIGASTCYILRSSQDFNLNMLDTYYPATNETAITVLEHDSPWELGSSYEGTYILGIAGRTTSYYALTKLALDDLLEYIFSDSYANALYGDEWTVLYPELKVQANPIQFVTSIVWVPVTVSGGTSVSSIKIGWVSVPTSGRKIEPTYNAQGTIIFYAPPHPQHERGEYLNNAPYSQYSLYFPPFGRVNLDSDVVANSRLGEVKVWWHFDLKNGAATAEISCWKDGNRIVLYVLQSQVGVPHQISQIMNKGYGLGNMIAPAITASVGMATGNPLSVISGIATGIGDFASSKAPTASTLGQGGSYNTLWGTPALNCEYKLIVDENIALLGRPLCENRTINTLSGYIKTLNASPQLAATQIEKEKIVSYMNGGFFYE